MEYDTKYLKNDLVNRHDISDIEDFINNYEAERINWKKYINELLTPIDSSYEKIAKKIGFSKGTVRKWCREGELPQNREAFIKLAFSLNMDIPQTNKLLTVYGHYSELYAKDINDIITMYVIRRRHEDPANKRFNYDSLNYWYKRYAEKIINSQHIINERYHLEKNTRSLYDKASLIKEEKEFEEFIEMNQLIFLSTFSALIGYLDEFICIRMREYEVKSFHKLIGELGIGAKYEKILSNLRQNGILPKRNELIALGIHLNMTLEEINILLNKANMKELYARDKMDCILMYFLNEAVKKDPDLLVNNSFKMEAMTKDPQVRKKYGEIVEWVMKLDYDPDGDMIERIADFACKSLAEMEFLEDNERKELSELLE